MTRRAVWVVVLLLGVTSMAAARSTGAQEPAEPTPDAQMLLDLDLLKGAELARDRHLLTRMRLLERLRVLETLPVLDGQTQTEAPPGEVK